MAPDLRWRWRQLLRDNRKLSPDARLAGHTLATRMQPHGECFYKLPDLSADMGLTDKKLRRARSAVHELEGNLGTDDDGNPIEGKRYLVRRSHNGKLTKYVAQLPDETRTVDGDVTTEDTSPPHNGDRTLPQNGDRTLPQYGDPNRTRARTRDRTGTESYLTTTSTKEELSTRETSDTEDTAEGNQWYFDRFDIGEIFERPWRDDYGSIVTTRFRKLPNDGRRRRARNLATGSTVTFMPPQHIREAEEAQDGPPEPSF